MYLYYDEKNPQKYREDQEYLQKLIEESEKEEEKEYYKNKLMVFRMIGEVWL